MTFAPTIRTRSLALIGTAALVALAVTLAFGVQQGRAGGMPATPQPW